MPDIDSANRFQVRPSGKGRVLIVGLDRSITEAEAVNLLAWLRLTVDPTGEKTEAMVREIKES